MFKITTWIIVGLALLGASAWGIMKVFFNYEQANYQVAVSEGKFEIRDYAPMIVAQGEFIGQRNEAIDKGFMVVASYIFGKNISEKKIDMTTPVMQQSSEKIPMTVPIMQAKGQNNSWTLSFVMPSEYTLQTLPVPNNPDIKLKEIPAKRFAVIRFSGMWTQSNLTKRTLELETFLKSKQLVTLSSPVYAFFNPPWTPWFLRRNEIMIEIQVNG